LTAAQKGGIRIIGPNCLGIMRPVSGLNATFAPALAQQGSVALLSQSGAICTALLDWGLKERIGFSAVVSTGSMLDIGWGTLIDWFGSDPRTRSIVIYMESIGDARSFLSAAREVALDKPILVIKAGKSELGRQAAASHTGSLTGADDVLDAAFRRVGVLRVHDLNDIFQMTEILARQPRPSGPRLTIVTNAGGPGVLAVDALIGLGGEPACLAAETVDALDKELPAHWSHSNPVDVIGDAGPDRYAQAVKIAGNDPNTDGLLVIMTPQAMTEPAAIARALIPFATLKGKPILASWMGGEKATAGEEILNAAGIPTFAFPDAAVRAFHYMWRYSYNLRALYETPAITQNGGRTAEATRFIDGIRSTGRVLLTEFESKQLLSFYEIPVVDTRLADSEDNAAAIANSLGYPVAVKLNSHTITHKAEIGGVQLSLANEFAVREAFRTIRNSVLAHSGPEHFQGVVVEPMATAAGLELILGSITDLQFGPVLLFGSGGRYVEVFQDKAFALPPLNTTLAHRLMEQTRAFEGLTKVRGRKPANLDELAAVLVRFSQLVIEQNFIREIDINPLLASPAGFLALDARVILHSRETKASDISRPAIRPYPSQYAGAITLEDGTQLEIRPVRPEDEPDFVRFHATLSEATVHNRYFSSINFESRVRHERLTRMCFVDYDRQMALVARISEPVNGHASSIVGIGRLLKCSGARRAEIAVLVSDAYQNRRIGTALVQRLIAFARDERLRALTASFLTENVAMSKLFCKLGFTISETNEPSIQRAKLLL
jgi:acetyltransferase